MSPQVFKYVLIKNRLYNINNLSKFFCAFHVYRSRRLYDIILKKYISGWIKMGQIIISNIETYTNVLFGEFYPFRNLNQY